MEKPERYLTKEELKDGSYYLGFCRNSHIAVWDKREDYFYYLRYKFGYMMETIKHFDDVKEESIDGFVPLEIIYHPAFSEKVLNYEEKSWLPEFQHKIGY